MIFELEKLQVDFATILRDYDYEYVTLYSDSGKTKTMTLLNIEDAYRTKIAYGWDEFYDSNNFKSGDKIQF